MTTPHQFERIPWLRDFAACVRCGIAMWMTERDREHLNREGECMGSPEAEREYRVELMRRNGG